MLLRPILLLRKLHDRGLARLAGKLSSISLLYAIVVGRIRPG
jgi:hypothetical protein